MRTVVSRSRVLPSLDSLDASSNMASTLSIHQKKVSKSHLQQHPSFILRKKANNSAYELRMDIIAVQRKLSLQQFVLGIVGILLMILQLELLWDSNQNLLAHPCPIEPNPLLCTNCITVDKVPFVPAQDGHILIMVNIIRSFITLTTIAMWTCQYRYYMAESIVLRQRHSMPLESSIWTSPLRGSFLFESICILIHPVPYIDYIDPNWPQLVIFSSIFMLTRSVFIFRVMKCYSSLNTSNGWFIGALTQVEFSSSFLLKTALKDYPIRCMSLWLMLLLLSGGYAIYVAERFLCVFSTTSCCIPMSFRDAEWLLMITILTVGYGDVVPKTNLGRVIAIASGFMGTIITALTIALTTNSLHLTRSEQKVNMFLRKDYNRRLITDQAARAIQAAFLYNYATCMARNSRNGTLVTANAAATSIATRNDTSTNASSTTTSTMKLEKLKKVYQDSPPPSCSQITATSSSDQGSSELYRLDNTNTTTDYHYNWYRWLVTVVPALSPAKWSYNYTTFSTRMLQWNCNVHNSSVSMAKRHLYDVLRTYRTMKRYVRGHDGVDPVDKQLTLLEKLDVNVNYIRAQLDTMCKRTGAVDSLDRGVYTSIVSLQQQAAAASSVHKRREAVSRVCSPIQEENESKEHANSNTTSSSNYSNTSSTGSGKNSRANGSGDTGNTEIDMVAIHSILDQMYTQLNTVNQEMESIKEQYNTFMKNTDKQLAKLENKIKLITATNGS